MIECFDARESNAFSQHDVAVQFIVSSDIVRYKMRAHHRITKITESCLGIQNELQFGLSVLPVFIASNGFTKATIRYTKIKILVSLLETAMLRDCSLRS